MRLGAVHVDRIKRFALEIDEESGRPFVSFPVTTRGSTTPSATRSSRNVYFIGTILTAMRRRTPAPTVNDRRDDMSVAEVVEDPELAHPDKVAEIEAPTGRRSHGRRRDVDTRDPEEFDALAAADPAACCGTEPDARAPEWPAPS
jgi:hypothetical protein